GWACLISPILCNVLFPRCLYPCPRGVLPADRARAPGCHRSRDIAATLRLDASPLASALPRVVACRSGQVRRALLPYVGDVPRGRRDGLPLPKPDGLPAAADQRPEGAAVHARLHARGGT